MPLLRFAVGLSRTGVRCEKTKSSYLEDERLCRLREHVHFEMLLACAMQPCIACLWALGCLLVGVAHTCADVVGTAIVVVIMVVMLVMLVAVAAGTILVRTAIAAAPLRLHTLI